MKKAILNKATLCGLISSMLLLASCGCASENERDPLAARGKPKYLLNETAGKVTLDDEYFIYHHVGTIGQKDKYAVELKRSILESTAEDEDYQEAYGTIDVPTYYNNDQTKIVTGLWRGAFKGCRSLSITLPETLTDIDYEAFLYADIESITIPYSIENIGEGAFYACPNLTTVIFQNDNASSSAAGAVTCACEQTTPGSTPVYCSLTTIPSFCFFKCTALTTITLPASIQEVSYEAFNGCINLSSDIYFQSIRYIRSRAFQSCYSLRKMYVSRSLFKKDNQGNTGTIEEHAFNFCDKENFEIYLCGIDYTEEVDEEEVTKNEVEEWFKTHKTWGWFTDIGDPYDSEGLHGLSEENNFPLRIVTGDVYYTQEWTFTIAYNQTDEIYDVTITKYNGPRNNVKFLSVPDSMDLTVPNRVTRVNKDAFDDENDPQDKIKSNVERLYLSKHLVAIENRMFEGWKELFVIDSTTACADDWANEKASQQWTATGRIDLHELTELKYIGERAFPYMGKNASVREKVQKIHLPANLVAVGAEAFAIRPTANSGNNIFKNVTLFQWDYDEETSRLEKVGNAAFYRLGCGTYDNINDVRMNFPYVAHEASKIIFPRTFKGFGISPSDITAYAADGFTFTTEADGLQDKYPGYIFAGSPLLKEVAFKGSKIDQDGHFILSDTEDLLILSGTFVNCPSLEKVVFEERVGKTITFHTRDGEFAIPAIGANAGRYGNDFRGDPTLQTIVLPNVYTKLRFQDFALQGNSRAAMYLTGTLNQNLKTVSGEGQSQTIAQTANPSIVGETSNKTPYTLGDSSTSISDIVQWNTIGDETFYQASQNSAKGYYGYVYNSLATSQLTEYVNSFGINQKMPIYENIHYQETINTGTNENPVLKKIVEVGTAYHATNNPNGQELVFDGKFAFVCSVKNSQHVATVSKYLLNTHDGSQNQTLAHIPGKITYGNVDYIVDEIGDSAFSAAYCDTLEGTVTVNDVLTTVEVPDSIKRIGDYAFLRAYGITKVSAYPVNASGVSTGNAVDYNMPSSLANIGKNAFTFTSIAQVLNIPYNCLFYENSHDTYDVASVFTNDLDLRRITFRDSSGGATNQTSSNYYSTTTYGQSNDKTTALYSGTTPYNDNRLLLVLNRSSGDIASSSDDVNLYYNESEELVGIEFDGQYKTIDAQGTVNPFLFGAYKMGYWFTYFNIGPSTLIENDVDEGTMTQVLFSAICNRSTEGGNATKLPIYLNVPIGQYVSVPAGHYDNVVRDLTTISGDIFNLGGAAFKGCNIGKINFKYKENGVIPEEVFADNLDATTIYITPGSTPGTVIHDDEAGYLDFSNSGYIEIGDRAFKHNVAVKEFDVSDNVSSFIIGEQAFYTDSNLTTVDLSGPTSLTIGAGAFELTGINSLTSPTATTLSIGAGAFRGLSGLTSFNFTSATSSLTIGAEAFKDTGLTTFEAPEVNNLVISDGAFRNCDSLTTLDFSGVTGTLTIGPNAFNDCDSLERIIWPSDPDTLVIIQNDAFSSCDILKYAGDDDQSTNFTFPHNNTSIGANAFKGCKAIVEIVLSPNLGGGAASGNGLGNYCFSECKSLQIVDVDGENPYQMYTNQNTFNGCTNLSSFAFEKFTFNGKNSVNNRYGFQVYSNSFVGCSNLGSIGDRTLIIPENYVFIGANAFKGTAYEYVVFEGAKMELSASCFENCSNLISVDFTNQDCEWLYTDHARDSSKTYNYVFKNCTNLSSLYLPTGFDLNMTEEDWMNINMVEGDRQLVIYTYSPITTTPNGSWRYVETVTDGETQRLVYAPVAYRLTQLSEANVSDYTSRFWIDYEGLGKLYLGNVVQGSYNNPTGTVTFNSGYIYHNDGTITTTNEIDDIGDVLDNGALTDFDTPYWMTYQGKAYLLGTAVSYDSIAPGAVTFSSGYVLRGDGYLVTTHQVTSVSDVVTNGQLNSTSIEYWGIVDGHPTLLGKAKGYSSSDGVFFSNNYRLVGNTFSKCDEISEYNDVYKDDSLDTTTPFWVDSDMGPVYLGTCTNYTPGIGSMFSEGYLFTPDGKFGKQITNSNDALTDGSLVDIHTPYWIMGNDSQPIILGHAVWYDETNGVIFSEGYKLNGTTLSKCHEINTVNDALTNGSLTGADIWYYQIANNELIPFGYSLAYTVKIGVLFSVDNKVMNNDGSVITATQLSTASTLISGNSLKNNVKATTYWYNDGGTIHLLGKPVVYRSSPAPNKNGDKNLPRSSFYVASAVAFSGDKIVYISDNSPSNRADHAYNCILINGGNEYKNNKAYNDYISDGQIKNDILSNEYFWVNNNTYDILGKPIWYETTENGKNEHSLNFEYLKLKEDGTTGGVANKPIGGGHYQYTIWRYNNGNPISGDYPN